MTHTMRTASVDSERTLPFPSNDRDRGTCSEATSRSPVATVVMLRGEHDCSTASGLAEMLSSAAALDDADLVVDLGDVTFMDASTLSVLVAIRVALGRQERSLTLRAPSNMARSVLGICGLSDLIEASSDEVAAPSTKAW